MGLVFGPAMVTALVAGFFWVLLLMAAWKLEMLLPMKQRRYLKQDGPIFPGVILGLQIVASAASAYLNCQFWSYVATSQIMADGGFFGSILGGVALPLVLGGTILVGCLEDRRIAKEKAAKLALLPTSGL